MGTHNKSGALAMSLLFIAVCGTPLLVAVAVTSFIPMPVVAQIGVGFLGLAFGVFFFLRFYGDQGYRLNAKNLSVRTNLMSEIVPYRNITEVAKVRRGRKGGANGTGATEHVEVRYEKPNGDAAKVQLSPVDPGALLHQIVAACPHLSEYAQARVLKTAAFREAEGALAGEEEDQ